LKEEKGDDERTIKNEMGGTTKEMVIEGGGQEGERRRWWTAMQEGERKSNLASTQ
jgi:hypothetical protein